ncbi:hypothetical protein [Pseudanabaena sp. ABRG5-3]|uniref:hypothetical protein n=1 Tax=Pseudanabaena sp. ABRG5-3 TaxID=685565 RepID=UPI000DC7301F|nr:hypothetical protein [Pseudanabaena sp. ABRG5-3]BBC22798.1 hypothetical protein ABRG53_0541 [Pseudanabaena sp. ABRG5-3]
MLTTVEGIYRNGQVELIESPNNNLLEGTRVIVTFLETKAVDLASQGIDKKQAEILRTSLATFAEDWNSPEMSIYDDYDAAKAKL